MSQEPGYISTVDVLHELEKVAEALESKDFHFGTLCLNKILESIDPEPPQPSPDDVPVDALSTSGHSEARKFIKALDSKDLALAAMCLRKAARAYGAGSPLPGISVLDSKALKSAVEECCHYIASADLSLAANCVRRAAKAISLEDAVDVAPVAEETAS